MDNNAQPQVGVGVIIVRDGLVLLGKRAGSHGAGTWAPPGGHLEFGESIESCARREVLEETGLVLKEVHPAPYTSDVMPEVHKHYVTCFVEASVSNDAEPRLMEPDKCSAWMWFHWTDLPEPLFEPMKSLVRTGFVPAVASTTENRTDRSGHRSTQ
jgi:8-oxo-dGTP diphosphatase